MTQLQIFDAWLQDGGAAALVSREHLMPVEGHDGVVFPATFAASEDKTFKGGYNIDEFPDGTNVCLIDTVGSQANRIEPLFKSEPFCWLVPQVVVVAGEHRVNILDAGHRAADAIVRCSALQEDLRGAFLNVVKGNATALAKLAPTSLVFGAWDSRDTQAKLPRLLASTIRAFNVRRLTRAAQYVPAMAYVDGNLLDVPADKAASDSYAARGFVHVPSSGVPGGVLAGGGMRRETTLHLAALRLLKGVDPEGTLALRRYILGLALVGFTHSPSQFLRQGCNLVMDPARPAEREEVLPNGTRRPLDLTPALALDFARLAEAEFGRGKDREVTFENEMAKQDLSVKGASTTRKKAAPAKSK